MRRTVALTAILLPLVILALRLLEKPPFILEATYAMLEAQSGSAVWLLIIRIAALVALVALVHVACRKHGLPEESLIVLIASPALLVSLLLPFETLLLAVILAAMVLLWERTVVLSLLAALVSAVTPAGTVIALFTAAALLARRSYWSAAVAAAAAVLSVLSFGLPGFAPAISELGSIGSISAFVALLALIGVLVAWDKKTYPLLLAAAGFVGCAVLFPSLSLAGSLVAAALAGHALSALHAGDWRLTSVRQMSLLLVVLALLFTAAATAAEAVRSPPGGDFLEVVRVLGSAGPGGVLVHPGHAAVLEWYGVDTRPDLYAEAISHRNFEAAQERLPRYVVLARTDEAENLRFLIEHTDNFVLLHAGDLELYEVVS